jgi:hypothetical protein
VDDNLNGILKGVGYREPGMVKVSRSKGRVMARSGDMVREVMLSIARTKVNSHLISELCSPSHQSKPLKSSEH